VHAYNINSVAFNSDGETFVSSDDLRVNLWNVNVSNEAFGKCYNILEVHYNIVVKVFQPDKFYFFGRDLRIDKLLCLCY
jgi:WD40 repeat protein